MISKTCGYGIRGIVYLAVKSTQNQKVGIQELSKELDIPQHFLGKVMQDLARRGLIHSIKGPNGGFYVTQDALKMPLIRVVEAIDGLGILQKCFLGREECSETNPCHLHEEFATCRNGIFNNFRKKTIGDLVKT